MRVAVTGIGIVSALGSSADDVSRALQQGTSGIVRDPDRQGRGFRSALTGKVKGFDPTAIASRKQQKSMGEQTLYALGAAIAAVRDSRLDPATFEQNDTGLIVGNDSVAAATVAAIDQARADGHTRHLGSGAIIQGMNSTVSMNLAVHFGIRGAAWTVSAACASGANAIGQAMMLIQSGQQSVVLCGGAQETSWQGMAAFDAIGAFAKDEGDPAAACRPFAKNRSGLVPSGGAAMLVLERLDRAIERNAPIYGELLGYGFSCDGGHLTQPTGDGALRAMAGALRHAKREPKDIRYVNAHATGTPAGDLAEGLALLELFSDGARRPWVSSTKSMTGHECWMAGASELVYSLLMIRDGFLAPTINLDEVDPALAGLPVLSEARRETPDLILSNSFGFGGTNAALVLSAWHGGAR